VALWIWLWLWPRLPERAWPLKLAADPLPEEIDTAAERDQWVASHWRVFSLPTLENVVLIGLLCVIYGQVLPERRTSDLELFIGIAAFVVINAAISLAVARRAGGVESMAASFGARVLVNALLVLGADWLLNQLGDDLNLGIALFFSALLSLLMTLDDRFRPVEQVRFSASRPPLATRT